ncbi:MAG TPA: glycosyltransferase [Pyrinomonadaceae bacterium]|jgi:glycosyltransferase involved in cell wall biosynthesis
MRICVVTRGQLNYSETFIRRRVTGLPAETTHVYNWPPWRADGSRWETALAGRAYYRALGLLRPRAYRRRLDAAYADIFERTRADAVLAEYGPTGVAVMGACRQLRLPLFVSFHGYDVSRRDVLQRFGPDYPELFRQAAGVFAVSRLMRDRLVEMGAPAERTHHVPVGADCETFDGADPASAPPLVVAAGRFVEKKAPHLTLEAFARALRACPEARLRMIGEGPLLARCRELSARLSVAHAVTFTGSLPHHSVAEEMRRARLFAQHSVRAESGDSEGAPVSIQEACASGLPVVSTRHAGIPEVIVEGETGLLVDEGDVEGMSREMLRLLRDPAHAAALGEAGRRRVRTHFSSARCLERLWEIIKVSGSRARR